MADEYALVVMKDGVPAVNDRISRMFKRKTPKQFIMKRPDGFDYVEVGYVRRFLDAAFPASWDITYSLEMPWEMIQASRQLVVKARLAIRDPFTRAEIRVVEAFGGGPMKVYKKDKMDNSGMPCAGLPIDFGNDFKSAAADALKKAASMLGVCQDIYEPKVERKMGSPCADESIPAESGPAIKASYPSDKLNKGTAMALTKAWRNKGIDDQRVRDYVKANFSQDSMMMLTMAQGQKLMSAIAEGNL